MTVKESTNTVLLNGQRVSRIKRMLKLAEKQPGELAEVMCFTIADTADLLAISPRTVRRYISDDVLQPVGIEGSPRLTLTELVRFTKESPLARRKAK